MTFSDPVQKKKIVIAFTLAFVSVSLFLSLLLQVHFAQPLTQYIWAQQKRTEMLLGDKIKMEMGAHPTCTNLKYKTSCFKKILKEKLPITFASELMIWSQMGMDSTIKDKESGLLPADKADFYFVENALLPWVKVDFKSFYVQSKKSGKLLKMSKSIFAQTKAKMMKLMKAKLAAIRSKLSKREPAANSWHKDQYRVISAQFHKFEKLEHP